VAEDQVSLVRRAQVGDREAMEELLRSSQGLARRIAVSVLGRQGLDDALQESYLLAFRKLPQLREPEAFRGWFSRLVLHVCYLQQRRVKVEAELPDSLASPDRSEAVVAALALRQAMARLSRKDRDVLILREVLQLSYDEVAAALRLPVGTVRSRLSAARKHLAERMAL
jgi:RNA polymerase sigma-70 factor (ECF subfamily)